MNQKIKLKHLVISLFILVSLLTLSCSEEPTQPPDDNNGGVEPPYEGKIIFSSRRGGSKTYNLFTMNPDGTEIKQLTFGSYDYFMPRWSPDGKKIAFATDSSATTLGASLFIMDADGTNIQPVKQDSGWRFPQPGNWPSWSPDGKKIAFSGGLNSEIFVVDLETGIMEQLTDNPYSDYAPDWSPDGMKIVFISRRDIHSNIYIMYSDGTEQNRVSHSDSLIVVAPSYSPDGKRIAVKLNGGLALFDIVTEQFEIIKKKHELPFTLLAPKWSSDGQFLIFAGDKTDYIPKSYIYKISLQTLNIEMVLEDSTANWPDWE